MAKGDVTGRAEDVTGPRRTGQARRGTGRAEDGARPSREGTLAPVTHEPDQKAPEKSLVFISLPA